METRPLGRSKLAASRVGLGCNNFGMKLGVDDTRRVIDAALDAGVTFLDTADMYGGTKSEEFIGAALAGRRGRAVIATKFGGLAMMGKNGERWGAREYVRKAAEASLARLRTRRASISTRCTSPTRRRRSKRRSARSASWCARARCARSAARTSPARMLDAADARGARDAAARASRPRRTSGACSCARPRPT